MFETADTEPHDTHVMALAVHSLNHHHLDSTVPIHPVVIVAVAAVRFVAVRPLPHSPEVPVRDVSDDVVVVDSQTIADMMVRNF